MSEPYVGREHIDGILAEAGMKEQALIAAGEKHMADSRSMILLAREIRYLRSALAEKSECCGKDADCQQAFKRAEAAEAKLAQEHENFLTVHRENLGLVNRNAALKAENEALKGKCGDGRTLDGRLVGCDQPYVWDGDKFRCVDCKVSFCLPCVKKHFAQSLHGDMPSEAFKAGCQKNMDDAKALNQELFRKNSTLSAALSRYLDWTPQDPGTKEAMENIRELMAAISPGQWDWTNHIREDGNPIESVEDVVDVLALSARKGKGIFLNGVGAKEGGEDIVVCYTGNGPKSAVNARFLANAPDAIRWLLEFSRAAMVRLEEAEKGSRKDAEAWLITTCVTVHEREHGPLLADCPHPICRALSALANTIEAMEERP